MKYVLQAIAVLLIVAVLKGISDTFVMGTVAGALAHALSLIIHGRRA